MERSAINELIEWKNSHRKKPLIVEGARQVGKTWLVKEFASKYYEDIAYINFEEQIYLRNLFETDFNVLRIIAAISAASHQNGITALKYFAENASEHHVIAAGSLLGLELHKQTPFPVGKVQFITLYPMSFPEFLKQYYYVGGML